MNTATITEQPTQFETLTALAHSDLDAYAISLAAAEFAHEADDHDTISRRFQLSHDLRRMEEAVLHDGATPAALLVALRMIADVQDEYPDQCAAHYALRAEFARLTAI